MALRGDLSPLGAVPYLSWTPHLRVRPFARR